MYVLVYAYNGQWSWTVYTDANYHVGTLFTPTYDLDNVTRRIRLLTP